MIETIFDLATFSLQVIATWLIYRLYVMHNVKDRFGYVWHERPPDLTNELLQELEEVTDMLDKRGASKDARSTDKW